MSGNDSSKNYTNKKWSMNYFRLRTRTQLEKFLPLSLVTLSIFSNKGFLSIPELLCKVITSGNDIDSQDLLIQLLLYKPQKVCLIDKLGI